MKHNSLTSLWRSLFASLMFFSLTVLRVLAQSSGTGDWNQDGITDSWVVVTPTSLVQVGFDDSCGKEYDGTYTFVAMPFWNYVLEGKNGNSPYVTLDSGGPILPGNFSLHWCQMQYCSPVTHYRLWTLGIPNPATGCSTPLSDSEWLSIRFSFPNLVRDHVCVEDNSANIANYNCFAWAAGITNQIIDLPELDSDSNSKVSKAELDAFYTAQSVAQGTVAYYGGSTTFVLHAAKKLGGINGSSKLGTNIRIKHDLNELADSTGLYGVIVANY